MRTYKLFLAVAAIAIAVFVVVGTVRAQVLGVDPVTPRVMSGADLGFRVEGLRGGTAVGTIVIKVNGEWVEAEIGHIRGMRPGSK